MARTRKQEIYKCLYGEMEIRFDDPEFYFEFGGETTRSESLADIRAKAQEALKNSLATEADWIPAIEVAVNDNWDPEKLSVRRIYLRFGKGDVRRAEWETGLSSRYRQSHPCRGLKAGHKPEFPLVAKRERHEPMLVYLDYDETAYRELRKIESLPDAVRKMFAELIEKFQLSAAVEKSAELAAILGDFAPSPDKRDEDEEDD